MKMTKHKDGFASAFIIIAKKIRYEFFISVILGAIPVIIYTRNPKELDDIVSGLLAIGSIIDYAGFLLIPYCIATAIRFGMRFISENAQKKLVTIHKMMTEVGTSFLTILRTGGGAMIGVLCLGLFTSIITLTKGDYIMLTVSVTCVLIACTCMAFLHEFLAKASRTSQYDNPIKLDRGLLR
jgi:hypothetical protein